MHLLKAPMLVGGGIRWTEPLTAIGGEQNR